MALEPIGHALRCSHRGFKAKRLLARESAAYESGLLAAIWARGVVVATCCGCRRSSADGACLAELATREDSCLDIIVQPSASSRCNRGVIDRSVCGGGRREVCMCMYNNVGGHGMETMNACLKSGTDVTALD
jgi:hypothetical protein